MSTHSERIAADTCTSDMTIAIFVRTANCNFNRFVNVFAVYYLFSLFFLSINITRVTNSLDPDQVQRPNCLQRLSVYDTSSQRIILSVECGIYVLRKVGIDTCPNKG